MFIDIGAQRVYYEVNGSGPPLVLLHGWGANINSLRGVFNHFTPHFKVYAIDLPGFGRSPAPLAPWGSYDYAELVSTWAQRLGVEAACVMGHSFGGRISIILGAKYPQMVSRLILVDSAGVPPRRGIKYHFKVRLAKSARKVLQQPVWGEWGQRSLERVYKLMGSSDYRNSGPLRATLVKVVNEDLRELLPRITQPALLVWGERDTATPVSDGVLMQRLIPNANLVVLPQAGHYAYLDQPVKFIQAVETFLKG